jgi:thiamine-monophosphate kinase
MGVYVSGPLGGSILGRHLSFRPRVELALRLNHALRIGAMIDLSDGLSRDLARLCDASNVGAVLDADAIPTHNDILTLQTTHDPLHHALHDGEDYEILFTTFDDPARAGVYGTFRIGWINAETGVQLRQEGTSRPLSTLAWEHST